MLNLSRDNTQINVSSGEDDDFGYIFKLVGIIACVFFLLLFIYCLVKNRLCGLKKD